MSKQRKSPAKDNEVLYHWFESKNWLIEKNHPLDRPAAYCFKGPIVWYSKQARLHGRAGPFEAVLSYYIITGDDDWSCLIERAKQKINIGKFHFDCFEQNAIADGLVDEIRKSAETYVELLSVGKGKEKSDLGYADIKVDNGTGIQTGKEKIDIRKLYEGPTSVRVNDPLITDLNQGIFKPSSIISHQALYLIESCWQHKAYAYYIPEGFYDEFLKLHTVSRAKPKYRLNINKTLEKLRSLCP
jgi:hypothetical protein